MHLCRVGGGISIDDGSLNVAVGERTPGRHVVKRKGSFRGRRNNVGGEDIFRRTVAPLVVMVVV